MPEEHKPISPAFLALAGLILIIISSAFVPAKWLGAKAPISRHTPVDFTTLKTTDEFIKSTDTDNNGILTWKEVIGSTDDGAQIIADLQDAKPDPEIAKALSDPNNLTASFSKNLVITSTYIKNNNITDEATQKKLMSGITQEEVAKTVSKKYTYNEIVIAKEENKESIRVYGNEMAKLLDNIITKKKIKEDTLWIDPYLETGKATGLDAITLDAKNVSAVLQKLLTIKVPQSGALYHLLVINQVTEYRDMLSNLSKADTDPMRAAIFIQKYPTILQETLLIHKKLSYYFTLKNIAFSPQERGYVFTVGYTLQ